MTDKDTLMAGAYFQVADDPQVLHMDRHGRLFLKVTEIDFLYIGEPVMHDDHFTCSAEIMGNELGFFVEYSSVEILEPMEDT